MANITELLQKILNARYGKDVRGSIHDAIQAMNQEIEDDRPTVINSMERAETAAETAEKCASDSERSKETADGAAKMAKSYTHGGTGLRENEDTDNAKYYKDQVENKALLIEGYSQTASDAAQTATEAANRAEQSVSSIGTSVEDAQAAATSAIESASSASNDAQNALQCASEASESAASSSQSASEAQASAEAAARSAEEAKAVANVNIATTEKAGIVKPDGTTITVDEDGTMHGQSKVDAMTGATAEKDGTSGTVPAPKVSDKDKFLRGDGTWAEAKQDLSAYYNNANYDAKNNKLQLMNGDTVLKEIEISGGGCTKISPKATVNPAIRNGNAKCKITWGDPDDVIADGVILSTWKGTKLVIKETGYPENENDGTVIVDNKTKDAYVSTGYEVTGLTNGNTYYFKLFPYSTDGIYNYQDSNNLLGNPNLVKLDSCTNMNLSLAMGSVTVSWEDPNAEKTVDENTATWEKTVLVYKQGSVVPSSISDGIVAVEETTRNQYSVDGFTVDGLTDGEQYSFALFAVSTEGVSSDATTATANLWATLIITTGETTLYGKEVTVTYGSSTVSGTFSSIGSVTLQIPWIGETTITSTDGTDTATSKVTISSYGTSYNNELSFLKIVTFANGTDEEISAMIQAHYNNKINIADYWAVGDTRNVDLSAMSATGVGESHRAQTVQFVIGDFEHDDLSTAINGHSKAAVTLLQKDCLMDATSASNVNNGSDDTEKGYMNSSNTNVGGWRECARRTWCNNVYFSALPSAWQFMVKTVNKKVSAGNNASAIETVQDKIFLAAEIEIFGSVTYSFAGEGTQYQYYKNATANRYKMPKWGSPIFSQYYWERSPYSGDTTRFCGVYDISCDASYYGASSPLGVAPCLCI